MSIDGAVAVVKILVYLVAKVRMLNRHPTEIGTLAKQTLKGAFFRGGGGGGGGSDNKYKTQNTKYDMSNKT